MKYGLKYRRITVYPDGTKDRGKWVVEKFYDTFNQALDCYLNIRNHHLYNTKFTVTNTKTEEYTTTFQLKVFCTEEDPEIKERLKKLNTT